jgi:Spy/CpxP family protein refolding chaperone
MKLALKAAIFSVSLLALASHVNAQPGPVQVNSDQERSIIASGANHMMRRIGPPFAALNLTDEQMERIHAIRESHLDKIMPKMSELMKLKHKQMDLIASPSYDKQIVRDLQTKINSLSGELADERLTVMLESDSVLTVEQKKELRHMMLMHEPPFGPVPMPGFEPLGPLGPIPMGPGPGPMGPHPGPCNLEGPGPASEPEPI